MFDTRPFEMLFTTPLRNGVSYAAKMRGCGIPMVNMKEIFAYDRIADQECELVPLTAAERASSLLEAGDLLFARQSLTYEGAGKCVLVMDGTHERTWESHLIRVRLDSAKAAADYYYYYFRSPQGRRSMETIIQQVAAAGIRGSDLRRLSVPHPPLNEQRAIGEVLGALDDKIAADSALTQVADELSRVVFSSMLSDTDSRPMTEVADFVNGKAFTKDASGTGRVVIRIAELNSGLGGSTVYNDIDVADQHLARPGDLLFAWSGSLTLHRWFRAEGIINQHIFKVSPKNGYPVWCVNYLLARKLDEFKSIAADKATTMGHIQRRHLDEPVDVPVAAWIEKNDALMTSLWQRALAAEEESLGLVTMRDALLPQLMSGKIRVKDVEQMVGDVV
jgi:type I restriction enzyme, S subunit